MAKLPFKTEPKRSVKEVGNEEIGVLEFDVLGDLTVREQAFITEHLSKHSVFMEVARIANKVARAAKIQPVAAHRFITKCITYNMLNQGDFDAKEDNLRVKYAREIEELSATLLKSQWERQLVTVTSLIRFRLKGMEKFSIEDARDMSQQLIVEVYSFALEEIGEASSDGDGVVESEKELAVNLGK